MCSLISIACTVLHRISLRDRRGSCPSISSCVLSQQTHTHTQTLRQTDTNSQTDRQTETHSLQGVHRLPFFDTPLQKKGICLPLLASVRVHCDHYIDKTWITGLFPLNRGEDNPGIQQEAIRTLPHCWNSIILFQTGFS